MENILIAGTGAMACLFAARLAAAGFPVTMFGHWAAGLEALRRDGVTLIEPGGQEQVYPVRVASRPEECAGACFALVLVKSWQTAETALQLDECLAPKGLALTLQNGLGNYEALAQVLSAGRVSLGVTTLGANLRAPGQVRAGGSGPVLLGAHPRLAPLVDMLQKAGFSIESVADTTALLWGKLVINAAINPATALLEVTNGELLRRAPARALLAAAAAEAAGVAAALGILLPYADAVQAAEDTARRTAANRSSMLQDVQRGAPTEIDAICGAIVQAAEQAGLPAPVNRTLWQLVKAKAQNNPL